MSIPAANPQTFGWIKGALRDSLDKAMDSVRVAESESDLSALTSVSDNLHQVRGSLQMVELEAAGMLAEELEKLSETIRSWTEKETHVDGLAGIKSGLKSLGEYLDGIENQSPSSPFRLVEEINSLRRLSALDEISAYELFDPPLQQVPFVDHGEAPVPANIRRTLAFNLRKRYRKALLNWLVDVDEKEHLEVIAEITTHLQKLSSLDVSQQLWWVAGGFIEAIEDGSIDADAGVKAQFARLDLEISRLKDESLASIASAPPDELLRRMLFYIGAIDEPLSTRIADIKQAIDLDAWFETGNLRSEQDELAAVTAALREIGESHPAEELDRTEHQIDRYFSGTLDLEQVEESISLLESMMTMARDRQLDHFAGLLDNIGEAIRRIDRRPEALQASSADIKIASALLLVRDSISGQVVPDDNWRESVDSRALLLDLLLRTGTDAEASRAEHARPADNEYHEARRRVLADARDKLARIEALLGSFESDPDSAGQLREVRGRLVEISSYLRMLGEDAVADHIGRVDDLVGRMETSESPVADADHESLAFVLASLGVGLDQMEGTGRFSDELLAKADERLESISLDAVDNDAEDGEPGSDTGSTVAPAPPADPSLAQAEIAGEREGDGEEEVDRPIPVDPLDLLLDQLEETRANLAGEPDSEIDRVNLETLFGRIESVALEDDDHDLAAPATLGVEAARAIIESPERHGQGGDVLVADLVDRLRTLHSDGAVAEDLAPLRERLDSLTGVTAATHAVVDDAVDEADDAPVAASGQDRQLQIDDGLREIFLGEFYQHLDEFDAAVKALRTDSEDGSQTSEARAQLLRTIHTLSGNCRNLGLDDIADCAERCGEVVDASEKSLIDPEQHRQLGQFVALCRNTAGEIANFGEASETSRQGFNRLCDEIIVPGTVTGEGGEPAVEDNEGEGDFDEEIRQIFLAESETVLGRINGHLGTWRDEGPSEDLLAAVRREFHTLKGSAAATGFDDISRLSHSVESLLEQGGQAVDRQDVALLNLLEETHDGLAADLGLIPATSDNHVRSLSGMVEALLAGDTQPAPEFSATESDSPDVPGSDEAEAPGSFGAEAEAAMGEAENVTGDALAEDEPETEETLRWVPPDPELDGGQDEEDSPASGFLRIENRKLADLINTSGELGMVRTQVKSTLESTRQDLDALRLSMSQVREGLREIELEADAQIRAMPESERPGPEDDEFDPLQLDRYSRLQAKSRELAEKLESLVRVERTLTDRAALLGSALTQQTFLGEQLQDGLISARMVLISEFMPRLRHIVRESARRNEKEVELTLDGGDIEVDRQVIETMMAPFEHMIRNSIGHGIETVEQRRNAGKPESGKLHINAVQQGTELVIEFSDDGAGLDLEKLSASAVEMGMIESADQVSEEHLLQIISQPGYSTSETVSMESGRGVGMDVVYQAVRELGGSMALNSTPGQGVRFQFRLPVTLAVTQVLMVAAGRYRFAILARSIDRVVRVSREDIVEVDDRTFVQIDDQQYSLVDLTARIGESPDRKESRYASLVMVRLADRVTAFEVDEFQETINIVSKNPGTQLGSIAGVSGVTVLPDSSIVLILDPGAFVDRAMLQSEALTRFEERDARVSSAVLDRDAALAQGLKRVLVVDDSLVVRKVMQKDLEGLGLEVITAVDGVDALEVLERESFDIALVDIEMPKMNGYELLVNLRADDALKSLPVIIVTSRSGEQHRVKALELGADEYLTKPYDINALGALMDQVVANRESVH